MPVDDPRERFGVGVEEKLGGMGKPVVLNYEDREIKFCCPNCVASFKKDPAKYLKKLDEAAAKSPTTRTGRP